MIKSFASAEKETPLDLSAERQIKTTALVPLFLTAVKKRGAKSLRANSWLSVKSCCLAVFFLSSESLIYFFPSFLIASMGFSSGAFVGVWFCGFFSLLSLRCIYKLLFRVSDLLYR